MYVYIYMYVCMYLNPNATEVFCRSPWGASRRSAARRVSRDSQTLKATD